MREKLKWVDLCFFFFKQKTAYEIVSRDWSSDVCSSDLGELLDAGDDPNVLSLAGQIMKQSNDSWFWINAQPVHVENGNVWLFPDGEVWLL